MDELDIKFRFDTNHDLDTLIVEVNKQRFVRPYSVYGVGNKYKDLNRERVRMFGVGLSEIGKEIERQAEHGFTRKVVYQNGLHSHFF